MLLSRNFYQKRVRVNFRNFYTVVNEFSEAFSKNFVKSFWEEFSNAGPREKINAGKISSNHSHALDSSIKLRQFDGKLLNLFAKSDDFTENCVI